MLFFYLFFFEAFTFICLYNIWIYFFSYNLQPPRKMLVPARIGRCQVSKLKTPSTCKTFPPQPLRHYQDPPGRLRPCRWMDMRTLRHRELPLWMQRVRRDHSQMGDPHWEAPDWIHPTLWSNWVQCSRRGRRSRSGIRNSNLIRCLSYDLRDCPQDGLRPSEKVVKHAPRKGLESSKWRTKKPKSLVKLITFLGGPSSWASYTNTFSEPVPSSRPQRCLPASHAPDSPQASIESKSRCWRCRNGHETKWSSCTQIFLGRYQPLNTPTSGSHNTL